MQTTARSAAATESAGAARAAAVQAPVAAAVADHDRAVFGTAGRVLLDLERDVRRARRSRSQACAPSVGKTTFSRPFR